MRRLESWPSPDPASFHCRCATWSVDLDVVPQPGIGAAIWLHATDVQAIHGHDNVTYNLSGDTGFTYTDIAQAMSIVLEREVSYTPVTPDELRSMLAGSGMGEAMAGLLVSLDEPIAAGMFAKAGDDLTRLTARPTTTLVDGL